MTRREWILVGVAAASVLAATAVLLSRRAPPEAPWQQFVQITDAAGEETSPAMSPEGTMVAYVVKQNGRWAIIAQRVGGRNVTTVVADAQHDYGGPAFSGDGSSIAFHEMSDHGGGIFVAGATGESVRRLTDFGYDPAWSPDGKSIAFTTEVAVDPESRQADSALYVVDATGGTPKKVPVNGDEMQAAWSPSGKRLAYWGNIQGQRDIFTVDAQGGTRVALTDDAAIDWAPQWSPDGHYVYFSSDRGGSMNLWRVPLDESSGRATGEPEAVTNGVQASAALPRFSKDGSRLAFRSRVKSVNPVSIPFDPATGQAGVPVVLDASNNSRIPSDVSPDSTQLALFNIGDRQEDLFLSSLDGSHLRRLTDDPPRDRAPMFTHDGRTMVFYSRREGVWGLWAIRTDGSGLRRVISVPGSIVYPVPSPVDGSIVYSLNGQDGGPFRTDLNGRAPVRLPNMAANGGVMMPTSWSQDAKLLAGPILFPDGQYRGVAIYEFATQKLTVLNSDASDAACWLPDSRHIVYFTDVHRQLAMVDVVSKQRTIVSVALPGPAYNDVFAVSRDGRHIFYGYQRAESDIWVAERK